MKGLILCAGKGTRLYPFTRAYPKTLIPVANTPILQTCIEKLAEQDIVDIGIVIHPSQEAMIKEQVGYGEAWGLQLTYIYQLEPKGISDAVKHAKSFVGDDAFLLLLGDNLMTASLFELKQKFDLQAAHAVLMLKEMKNPQDFGVAEVAGPRIIGLEEKPLRPKSNLAVMGAYAFGPAIFDAIAAISPSARGEYEITDAIQWLIDQNLPVSYQITANPIFDVGTIERWLEANQCRLDERGTDWLHKSAVLNNCKIVQPVAIAQGCVLKNCRIGPYVSIGAGVNIEGCRIQNSIIMNHVHLNQIPYTVKDTIIGPKSVFTGAHTKGRVAGT